MKEIAGKLIYETTAELVHPGHTALLVIDMQNDHGPRGFLAQRGGDVSWAVRIVPAALTLTSAFSTARCRARRLGAPRDPTRSPITTHREAWLFILLM